MRRELITCSPQATLGQVASLLLEHKVHTLVVSDPAGSPLGLISDFDLLAGEWLATDAENLATMRRLTAAELMSSPLESIEADAPLAEAARRLQLQGIHRLLVRAAGQPAGIISISDLVAYLAEARPGRATVAEVMSQGIVVCLETTPLRAVARAMTERRSRSVVVVTHSGRPLGLVTGVDLLPYIESGSVEQPVSTVMRSAITIQPQATLAEAAALMVRHHIHRLLVIDPNRPEGMPLGLISTSDIVAEMAAPGSAWQSEVVNERE
jgi:CBS domain-containing protein